MRAWTITAVLTGLAVCAGVLLAAQATDTPTGHFTRDPAALADLTWYVGSVSLLTSIVWGVGVALSSFVAWIEPRLRRQLLPLALLTAVLGADDALMLHERLLRDAGVPELLLQAVYAVLGILVASRLVPWRRGPAGEVGRLYVVGCVALAVSLLIDDLLHTAFLAEDTAKLIGAVVFAGVPVLAHARATSAHGRPLQSPGDERSAEAGSPGAGEGPRSRDRLVAQGPADAGSRAVGQ